MKKIFWLATFFFLISRIAYASLEINEIMYDLKTGSDDGREWVEVFNNSDIAVKLSDFKFFEAGVNHKIIFIEGNENIPSQGYALIVVNPVKFKIDWPEFSGTIFDSTFTLNNSGETLAIKNSDQIIDEYKYLSSQGGAGDGTSIQKINGLWQGAFPTPGIQNRVSFIPSVATPISSSKTVETKLDTPIESHQKQLIQSSVTKNEIQIPNLSNENKPSKRNHLNLYVTTLFAILSVGAIVVALIRRRKTEEKIGEDFDIFDE